MNIFFPMLRGIPQNPGQSAVVPGLASLFVPGLGQFMIGQKARGVRLFLGSAAVLFGFGILNILIAYDAWSLARRLQTGDITNKASSWTLILFGLLWDAFCWVFWTFLGLLGGLPIIKEVLTIRNTVRHGR